LWRKTGRTERSAFIDGGLELLAGGKGISRERRGRKLTAEEKKRNPPLSRGESGRKVVSVRKRIWTPSPKGQKK